LTEERREPIDEEADRCAHRGMQVLLRVLEEDTKRNPDCHLGLLYPELEAAALFYLEIERGVQREATL
jgi:hypothetical protein